MTLKAFLMFINYRLIHKEILELKLYPFGNEVD